ncbi:MAG: hypothetical protein JXB48_09890 [Candidatus Latescibacteria bacterium]|nr:hypothetical protein [Candidatus Latescibacterota bacterium]
MIQGIIIGHVDIGNALIDALHSISGMVEFIEYISNKGLSTNELAEIIKSKSQKNSSDGVMLFVDMYGGSCWRAAKMARVPNSHIVTGINLPMLLSFIQKRNTIPIDELPAIMEIDGKRAITSE